LLLCIQVHRDEDYYTDKTDKSDAQAKLLNQQLSGLDAMLQEQSQAVKDLSSQLNSIKGAVSNVDGLKKDVETLANLQRQRNQEALQAINTANARREKELKDKERELARERDLLNEREAIRERELAQERAALQAIPAEKTKEKIKDKDRVVQYSREQQSKLNGSGPAPGMPAYTRQAGSQPQ
jgi:chromosome segregation ATPase